MIDLSPFVVHSNCFQCTERGNVSIRMDTPAVPHGVAGRDSHRLGFTVVIVDAHLGARARKADDTNQHTTLCGAEIAG